MSHGAVTSINVALAVYLCDIHVSYNSLNNHSFYKYKEIIQNIYHSEYFAT